MEFGNCLALAHGVRWRGVCCRGLGLYRAARRLRCQTTSNQPTRSRTPAPRSAAGRAINAEPRLATRAPSPPDWAVKSCGPTTVPDPPNVADGLKESTSQRPRIFLTSPVKTIESDLDFRDSIINSKPTSVGDAKSTVHA